MNADIPIVSVLLRAVLLVISVLAVGFSQVQRPLSWRWTNGL